MKNKSELEFYYDWLHSIIREYKEFGLTCEETSYQTILGDGEVGIELWGDRHMAETMEKALKSLIYSLANDEDYIDCLKEYERAVDEFVA